MITKDLVDQLTDLDGYTETSRIVRANDIRSPLAKARDEWFESFEGRGCSNIETLRSDADYLHNRLELAFGAGAEAMKRIINDAIAGA